MEDATHNQIYGKLLGFFDTHRELARSVRLINHTFSFYMFLMTGTNIPTMVFSLLALITVQKQTLLNIIVGAASVTFSSAQLICLTLVPAQLHENIRYAEQAIFNCCAIWHPYNERVGSASELKPSNLRGNNWFRKLAEIYSLAHGFIAHINQRSLGVTLWGIVVVTKRLILTVNFCTIFEKESPN
ncbi:unnamed protein product [Gongylonema pulchrum]|uniref:ABC transmembrane type-1 domain-containing protein n=1 Tax=Gongylonema pulchrum TaxID=637853 RepID=A0A183EMP7_9BILA|nr:unnamed protein product [Gongylonema pulchrum]